MLQTQQTIYQLQTFSVACNYSSELCHILFVLSRISYISFSSTFFLYFHPHDLQGAYSSMSAFTYNPFLKKFKTLP